ncbi:MAG: phosphomannomutase/phosphoglucomutase [Candidatus Diapherotrites archaeon]
MNFNPEIFREYDIRGLAKEELTPELVAALGKAFGFYIIKNGGKKIAIGRDNRPSSERISGNLVEGIISTGLDVVDVGLVPTPVLYYAVNTLEVNGGAMVTASHNPPEFNGFKLLAGKDALFGEQIQEIREIIERGEFPKGNGKLSEKNVDAGYVGEIKKHIKLKKGLKVVLDCGNGVAGPMAVKVLEEIGTEVVPLYCEMDGSFPNHLPDPTQENLMQDLINRVKKENADLGIGIDGDGDRIGVVTAKGEIVWGDKLLALYSREVLEKNPGATIVFEVKCSQLLPEEIERLGGNPLMYKTGHSLIKAKMKEINAKLAGEMSGHMFFADGWFGFDDAIYSSARLLQILSGSGKNLGEIVREMPKYYSSPEIRLDCPDDAKFKVVEKIREIFREKYEIIDIDGARVLFGDGWGLVRASNTQPKIIVRYEAKSEERLSEIKEIMETELRKFKEIKFG